MNPTKYATCNLWSKILNVVHDIKDVRITCSCIFGTSDWKENGPSTNDGKYVQSKAYCWSISSPMQSCNTVEDTATASLNTCNSFWSEDK